MATDFPKRLPEKLKAIREHLAMTPDQLAAFVGAKSGAEILAFENDEDDLLVSVLICQAKSPRYIRGDVVNRLLCEFSERVGRPAPGSALV